jgi:endoglucanase
MALLAYPPERHHGFTGDDRRLMFDVSPFRIGLRSASRKLAGIAPPPPALPAFLRGVNLAGAEFGLSSPTSVPGTAGSDYFWPADSVVDYYLARGMTVLRVPVLWERLQRTLLSDLNAPDMAELDRIITRATSAGAHVVIDLHNHMRRWVGQTRTLVGTGSVTRAALNDFWRRMAIRYRANPLVIFGLMNEPNSDMGGALSDADNVAIQNGVAAAIRATRATNLILFSANRYSAMHQFTYGDTAYKAAHLGFLDPGGHSAWDLHQFLDVDYRGAAAEPWTGDDTKRASTRVRQFIDFARSHGLKVFYGEFNTGSSAASEAELRTVLDIVEAADDVFIGWCWWAGGGHWPTDTFYSLDPLDGEDRAQLGWLREYADPTYSPPLPAPVIAVTNGSGYAGSTITVTHGGTGSWQVDATEAGGWTDLPDATGPAHTQTTEREGLPLRWRRNDGQTSNVVHMWMPNDLGAPYVTAAGASWVDFKRADLLTLNEGKIVSASDRFGSARTFAQGTAGNRPTLAAVDGYPAALWPDSDNNVELTASGNWAPAFVMMATRYRDGTQASFATYETLIADPASATSQRVMGQVSTNSLFASDPSKIWTLTVRKNLGPASATVLPLPRSLVSFSGVPVSARWSIGGRNGGASFSGRGWKGPLWELVGLAAVPTDDALARLAACLAHRNGTIAALAANQPGNPYLNAGPLVA